MNNTGGKLIGWCGFALTMLKPVLGGLVVYLIVIQSQVVAAAGIFLVVIADIFDGVIFRASPLAANTKLAWIRRIADVVGDRLVVQAVLIAMVLYSRMPIWFYAIATVRELGIATMVGYSQLTKRPVKKPNMASRVAVACQAVMAILWLTAGFAPAALAAAFLVAFGTVGGWQYWQSIRQVPKREEQHELLAS